MVKKLPTWIMGAIILCCQTTFAASLIDVYCQAVKCDPTFNAQYALLMANIENVPISRADLLPRLDVHADIERQKLFLQGLNFSAFRSTGIFFPTNSSVAFYSNSLNYYLKLTQPLYNYSKWAKLEQSKASARQAQATFCTAAQDLMVRVTKAYFDVMTADANLFYTRQNKKAVAEQLRDSKIEFDVGTVPKTTVHEAQARYDLVVAQEVNDRYALAQAIEHLRTITNHLYCDLKGLHGYLPLIIPQPTNINNWVNISEKQNYQLQAARYGALAARQNIKVQAGGKFPVVNSFGELLVNNNSNFQGTNYPNNQQIIEGGLELNWAPIQGGGVIARTTQAEYQYQQACLDQERVHREIISNSRNAYLGIFSGIAQVKAYRQAIISGQLSLNATIESYKVGTRTILDVLNQETQFYNAEKSYIQARYNYIYQIILLKQAAGTLDVSDLQAINCWLYSPVNISMYDALLDGCLTPTAH